jgi:CHASE3 domain sensor protein
MKNPILRLVLALLAVAACCGAGYYVFFVEQRAAAVRNADRGFTEDVLRLQATLADLRAAQAGYLAIGQDAAVWIQKASQLRQQADAQLKRLVAATPGPEADGDLATVGEALGALGRFDTRVTELLREEQTLAASALIFSDSAQVVGAATAALSNARGARASKTGTALAALRQQELYGTAGAGAIVLLVLLLLVPVRRAPEQQAEEGEQPPAASDTTLFAPVPQPPLAHVGVGADLDLALERRSKSQDVGGDWVSETHEPGRVLDLEVPRALAPAPSPALVRPRADSPRPDGAPDVPLRVDLAAAAQLCTDLARVRDTSELQGLLTRAAALLDASGIVVWMGGAGGEVLWPAFSHGYTPHALSKMQALPRDGGTPVSVTFRTGLMEVVPAAGGTSGAIVAPILTSTGCVGVMAVEIRHGAETSDAEQAVAGILAAQLATLVAGEQG